MSKMNAQNIRGQLRLAASALAIAAGSLAIAGGANAQAVITPTSGQYDLMTSTDKTVEITSGTNAYYLASNVTWGVPWGSTMLTFAEGGKPGGISADGYCIANWNCGNAHAPVITVDSGASLHFVGRQSVNQDWFFGNTEIQSAIVNNGELIFEDAGPVQSWGTPAVALLGSNKLLGKMTLLDKAVVNMGLDWSQATNVFGANTAIDLQGASVLNIYQSGTAPLVMGGILTGTGTLNLGKGGATLVINGQNTAATPFLGTVVVAPGDTLVIGDAAHKSAVFGDPGHATAQTLLIKGNSSGAPILRGFGTVAATVVNEAGVVQPGYGTGTLGTLTVAAYKQDNVGTLKVEVSPDAVSGLHVLGNAALAGSLNVTIGAGNYATKIYDIIQVDGAMTGSFSSITTSSSVAGAIAAVTRTDHGYQVVTEVVQGKAATAPVVQGHLISVNRLNNTYFVNALYDQIAMGSPRDGQKIGRNKYAWVEGFGGHSSVSRNDVGYHQTTSGVRVGAEYRDEQNRILGIAGSYSASNLKAKGSSKGWMDTWHIAAYGGADVQNFRLDGAVFYSGYSSDTKRDFGSSGVAAASPSGYAFGGSMQVSLPMFRGLVTPYLRGIVSRQHLGGSSETGSPLLNLHYGAINGNYFVGDFGVKIDPLRSYPDSKTKLLLTLAVEHDFSTLGEKVVGTFPVDAGQPWSAYWRGDSENTAVVGIDLAHKLTDQLEISGRLNGRMSLYQTSGEVGLSAKYRL